MNMLLTSILFCSAGPGFLIRTVGKYSMLLLITDIIFTCSYIYMYPSVLVRFFFRGAALYFEKAVRLSGGFLMLPPSLGSTLCLSSVMCTSIGL